MKTRDSVITVRLTSDEYSEVFREACRRNTTVSVVVRAALKCNTGDALQDAPPANHNTPDGVQD